jgi:hypothetical protein
MYFTDGRVQMTDAAMRALQKAGRAIASVTGQRGYTSDALPERSKPDPDYGAEISELRQTQDLHSRAIAVLGRSLPVGDQQGVGAVSWNRKGSTGYEEFEDGDPDSDVNPADEREKVANKLDYQNAKNDGPNRRADGTGDSDAELPRRPSVASIQGANEVFWKRDRSSLAGNSAAEEMETNTAIPRQAGTINVEGRKSTTAQTLDPGWTGDRRMQRIRAAQDARTAATLAGINSKWQARR